MRYKLAASLVGGLAACVGPARPPIAPNVAPHGHVVLDDVGRGRVLLGELGCANCHPSPANVDVPTRRGPDLAAVATRLRVDFLHRFVADPHAMAPGTAMPGLLLDLRGAARDDAAHALVDYLRSFAVSPADAVPAASSPGDEGARGRGRELFHRIGCVACHAPRDENDRELPLPDAVPFGDLGAKWQPAGLRAFLLAPLATHGSGRMPDLHLTPAEATDLTAWLIGVASPPPTPAPVDAERVARGRELFAAYRCDRCHTLPDAARPRAADVHASLAARGCVGDAAPGLPAYELSGAQQQDLAAALAATGPRDPAQALREQLGVHGCLACHRRGDDGGPARSRLPSFTGTEPNLGDATRLPPALTHVGAKLQPEWLRNAIAHGQTLRPYVRTRMPAFGEAIADALAPRFPPLDALPPLPRPLPALAEGDEAQRAVHELGRELVGERGMNCISCHTFAGEAVGAMAGLDLVDSTGQRLRREWFHHYLREPFAFAPGTVMPQFFVGETSARPALGDGDVTRQIDAIWQYLAAGRNTQRPPGLRLPPLELVVGDEVVLQRRSTQRTGKRAIAVGYPGGVNLAFDAESLALDQIWWGRFVDASGVFRGQGSGELRPLGNERVELPRGPAFAMLAAVDAPWPTTPRRDQAQQWRGYDLDAQQQPTFRYTCGDVAIADAPSVVRRQGDGERATLRRRLQFTTERDATVTLRVAVAATIRELGTELGTTAFAVGPSLRVRLPAGTARIVAAPTSPELRATMLVPRAGATLVVDYDWQEANK